MSVPTGTILSFYGFNPPQGFLVCDGELIARAQYPALHDLLIQTNPELIKGNEICSLPDLRGIFLRGADRGRQVDPDWKTRTVGSEQDDAVEAHNHSFSTVSARKHATTDGGSGFEAVRADHPTGNNTRRTNNTGGRETRPRNVAVCFMIKI